MVVVLDSMMDSSCTNASRLQALQPLRSYYRRILMLGSVVFVDDSHKGLNARKRRRHWWRLGQTSVQMLGGSCCTEGNPSQGVAAALRAIPVTETR